MRQPSRQECAELMAWIDERDHEERLRWPDGFLRRPYFYEDKLLCVENLLGVICTTTREGFWARIGFADWATVVRMYDGEPPWEAAEAAEGLGCSLVDLGVIRRLS